MVFYFTPFQRAPDAFSLNKKCGFLEADEKLARTNQEMQQKSLVFLRVPCVVHSMTYSHSCSWWSQKTNAHLESTCWSGHRQSGVMMPLLAALGEEIMYYIFKKKLIQ